ncbi:MAG: hypothetical protein HW421_2409 [Ignavibacteria bacterium]|nr:hypothetical protein [Ignavibacteria bacterium]
MTERDRLFVILNEFFNGRKTQLAQALSINVASLEKYFNGERSIGNITRTRMEKAGINPAWMQYGVEPCFMDNKAGQDLFDKYASRKISKQPIKRHKRKHVRQRSRKLEFAETIPTHAYKLAEITSAINPALKNLYSAKVLSNNLKNFGIEENSIVIIERGRKPVADDFILATAPLGASDKMLILYTHEINGKLEYVNDPKSDATCEFNENDYFGVIVAVIL